jgi:L-fuconolactonase
MLIVDSQVHIESVERASWEQIPERGLTLAQRKARTAREYGKPTADQLVGEMDRAGVTAAVLVPPLAIGSGSPNEPSIAAARAHPGRFGVMARLPVDRGSCVVLLDELREVPEVIGVRMSFHANSGTLEMIGELDWLWSEAEERRRPVMIYAPGCDREVGSIARRHPGLSVIVDHLGLELDTIYTTLHEAIAPTLALSQYENVAVKASALPCSVEEGYPFPSIREALRETTDAFGPSRVFWGSDMSRLPCTYASIVRCFREELDFLSDDQLGDVMGSALLRWLKWGLCAGHAGPSELPA